MYSWCFFVVVDLLCFICAKTVDVRLTLETLRTSILMVFNECCMNVMYDFYMSVLF